ncbi:MAG: DUF58 domain-containing protein [Lentisphaerae bacterium]|nr:DUF58 domain-containing protein [Lentisphaerota bacterium]
MNQKTISEFRGESRHDFLDPQVLARLSKLNVVARGLVEGSFTGMHKSPHKGSSVEFAQYRKYVPGDDIKNVDWKIYAKTDRFYIKEYEADTNLRCHLVVDSSASMGFKGRHGSKLDYTKRMAATLAQLLILQGDAVGLQCFNEKVTKDIPARGSPKHLRNIFEILSEVKPEGKTRIVDVLHHLAEKIRKRAMIIVFSDFFTDIEEILDCFQHMRFRKHDLAVFHLMDPEELNFDFDRSTRFLDMESSFSIVTEPAIIKNEYLKELNHYLDRMMLGCREFHVDYRFTNISRTYDSVLSEFLLSRQRK